MLTAIQLAPLQIGPIAIDPPLLLAPMAGQTNHAFRSLCREMGDCGLVCTEVISSSALQQKATRQRTLELFDWRPSESPLAVQLSGSEPDLMAEAARIVVDNGADIVDINMGCWVPKVAKKGHGAALLRDVDTAAAVVQAVVDAAPSTPVTVKIRSGWSPDAPTAVPFARAAAELGVKAIAVHARFAGQGFNGAADWDMIRQVKASLPAAVTMPIIGNGDVLTPEDAAAMLDQTGCDGIMIGRGALGNPWIFRQMAHYLRTGDHLPDVSPAQRAQTAIRQARLTLETSPLPPHRALLELRGQLLKYAAHLPQADTVREALCRADSLAEIEAAFAPVL
jgi:nifR3 family TIM-barrel protein